MNVFGFFIFLIFTFSLPLIDSLIRMDLSRIDRWIFIKFNETLVFPVPKRPIITILHRWSGI